MPGLRIESLGLYAQLPRQPAICWRGLYFSTGLLSVHDKPLIDNHVQSPLSEYLTLVEHWHGDLSGVQLALKPADD